MAGGQGPPLLPLGPTRVLPDPGREVNLLRGPGAGPSLVRAVVLPQFPKPGEIRGGSKMIYYFDHAEMLKYLNVFAILCFLMQC